MRNEEEMERSKRLKMAEKHELQQTMRLAEEQR